MIPIEIRPNLELTPWDDISRDTAVGSIERVGLLPNGTSSGHPAFAMVVRLEDGSPVVVQTTWALMSAALRALAASPVGERDRMEHGG